MKDYDALDSKCPSCGAQIIWEPSIEKFKCEYCGSLFSADEFLKLQENEEENNKRGNEELVSFKCNNCGAEIVSDVNTYSIFVSIVEVQQSLKIRLIVKICRTM